MHFQQVEATAKRLELLRNLLPGIKRVAVLADRYTGDRLTAARAAAKVLGLVLHVVEFSAAPYDYARAMGEVLAARSQASLLLMSPQFFAGCEILFAEAAKRKMPVVGGLAQFAQSGAVASYGASIDAMYARTADYADKIIKGKRPSDLPMEQPTVFDFVVNQKAARALGIQVPRSMWLQATNVID